ncbi:uncharacterized protein LOC143851573 isoform X2 [Tasmannia lanceolata]|uniref:uncharacterized protein LOC143851573 isoform X2 n=1 Tax=Tasmannia lanceolata TaxID=3420 RepID=UPI004062F453
MENDTYNASLPIKGQNRMAIDPTTSHLYTQPLNMHSDRRNTLANCLVGNSDLQDHFVASSHVNFLASTSGLLENLIVGPISATLASPLEDLRTFVSNDGCNTSNSSLSNCSYGRVGGGIDFLAPNKDASVNGQPNSQWGYNEILGYQGLPRKTPMSKVSQSYHVIGSSQPGLVSNKSSVIENHPYMPQPGCIPSNELSLSLATCQSPFGSRVRHPAHNFGLGMGLGLEKTPTNTEELFPGCDSYRSAQFLHMLLRSKYLHVTQEILSEFSCYALQNLNILDHSLDETSHSEPKMSFSSCSTGRGTLEMRSDQFSLYYGEIKAQGHLKLKVQRRILETKKAELLAMLQVVQSMPR